MTVRHAVAACAVALFSIAVGSLPDRSALARQQPRGPAPGVTPRAAIDAAPADRDERAAEIRRIIDRESRSSQHVALTLRKAELELAILEAQVEMKQAEIKRHRAEATINQLAPDLAILDALAKPVAMPFPNETPLEDVLKHIKKMTTSAGRDGIPIYVDPVGLQEAEKTMSSSVAIDLVGIPLETTLRLVLRQLGLTYQVRNGLLTITSVDAADRLVNAEEQ